MANVVKVRLAGGRSGKGPQREEHATWEVDFDRPDWTVSQALVASDGTTAVPVYADQLAGDPSLFLTAKNGSEKSALCCKVECTFTQVAPSSVEKPDYTNHKWNINVAGSGLAMEEEVNADGDGKMITSSATTPLQPFLKRFYQRERIVVEWDTDVPDWATYAGARGHSNAASVTINCGAPARWSAAYHYPANAWCSKIVAGVRKCYKATGGASFNQDPEAGAPWVLTDSPGKRTFAANTLNCEDVQFKTVIDSNGQVATHVTVILIYDAETWVAKPVDQDFNELGPDGQWRRIHDGVASTVATDSAAYQAASPCAVPKYLNGAGKQLAYGDPAVLLDGTGGRPGPYKKVTTAAAVATLLGGI